ncbi:phosphatidic acid-preferring phospholipase A1, contains DDHD domain, partial [Teratosphaeria destructans]
LPQRDTYAWDDASHLVEHSPAPEKRQRHDDSPKARVPVGVSRLHQVEMPELVMQPIYWTPVHDTAEVLRGTHHDAVETHVANMLEAGYVELQVWTETWKDELKSAIEVGASGEEKITHKLWPDRPRRISESKPPSIRGNGGRDDRLRAATFNTITVEPETPESRREKAVEAACDIIDISTGPGGADNKAVGRSTYGNAGAVRNYASCGVIYANDREARILKPSLMPSSYYGRRPLANYIRKGHKLGITVVRGFDEARGSPSQKAERAEQGVATSASGVPPKRRRRSDPELAKAERPAVSDLVLVIHGIGQKLSQRMESFHFTHAMNAFRRDVHVEAGTGEVKTRFRKDMGGIMVLPVNWRHSLSFEEGGYRDGPVDTAANEFSLKDITPDTLPSVRNIVSDVMLDIPYYMSHHQPKMIAAVIREANRVYKLWCQNNPGFAQHGRVHIIGHSLGSVMAIDILSHQPTTIPEHLRDPTQVHLPDETITHFLFNTSNLFLAGSPAGFFLLLRRAQLLPRMNYKATELEADPTANTTEVCGERGKYGCLAVENLYNIINGYDPVSYRMNAAVDAAYAASIKKAMIPASTPGWFSSKASSTSWFAGNPAASSYSASSYNRAPPLPRLPSNVELDIHDFTREEIAERRMYLLNDNGQIDFFLRYGGGPLEIQYLTMLGAHSSYWLLKDFTRMIVTEVGRPPGREGTSFGMRAVKRKERGA